MTVLDLHRFIVFISLVILTDGQSFWETLKTNGTERPSGWDANTTTPAYDPNTSTPGSTVSMEAQTLPSESKRFIYNFQANPDPGKIGNEAVVVSFDNVSPDQTVGESPASKLSASFDKKEVFIPESAGKGTNSDGISIEKEQINLGSQSDNKSYIRFDSNFHYDKGILVEHNIVLEPLNRIKSPPTNEFPIDHIEDLSPTHSDTKMNILNYDTHRGEQIGGMSDYFQSAINQARRNSGSLQRSGASKQEAVKITPVQTDQTPDTIVTETANPSTTPATEIATESSVVSTIAEVGYKQSAFSTTGTSKPEQKSDTANDKLVEQGNDVPSSKDNVKTHGLKATERGNIFSETTGTEHQSTDTGITENAPLISPKETGSTEPTAGKTEIVQTDTTPGTTETGQTETAPGTTSTETGPTETAPGTTATETGQTETAPSTTGIETGQTETAPGTTATETGQTETAPATTATETGQAETAPGTTLTETGQTETAPGTTSIETGQTETAPGTTATETGPTETAPGTTATETAQAETASGTTATETGQKETAPSTTGIETGQTETAPGTTGTETGQPETAPSTTVTETGQAEITPGITAIETVTGTSVTEPRRAEIALENTATEQVETISGHTKIVQETTASSTSAPETRQTETVSETTSTETAIATQTGQSDIAASITTSDDGQSKTFSDITTKEEGMTIKDHVQTTPEIRPAIKHTETGYTDSTSRDAVTEPNKNIDHVFGYTDSTSRDAVTETNKNIDQVFGYTDSTSRDAVTETDKNIDQVLTTTPRVENPPTETVTVSTVSVVEQTEAKGTSDSHGVLGVPVSFSSMGGTAEKSKSEQTGYHVIENKQLDTSADVAADDKTYPGLFRSQDAGGVVVSGLFQTSNSETVATSRVVDRSLNKKEHLGSELPQRESQQTVDSNPSKNMITGVDSTSISYKVSSDIQTPAGTMTNDIPQLDTVQPVVMGSNADGLFNKESGKLKTEPRAYQRQVGKGKGKGRGQNRLETKQISTMENNQGANNNEKQPDAPPAVDASLKEITIHETAQDTQLTADTIPKESKMHDTAIQDTPLSPDTSLTESVTHEENTQQLNEKISPKNEKETTPVTSEVMQKEKIPDISVATHNKKPTETTAIVEGFVVHMPANAPTDPVQASVPEASYSTIAEKTKASTTNIEITTTAEITTTTEPIPTTEPTTQTEPTTTTEPTTQFKPTTTEPTTTTEATTTEPITTTEITTTPEPTTTKPTTPEPTTTIEPTTPEPTTTIEPTTPEPTTTTVPTTTQEPTTTTTEQTTTPEPTTTTEQTTTPEPTTTTEQTTTPEPTTQNVATTTEPTTTERISLPSTTEQTSIITDKETINELRNIFSTKAHKIDMTEGSVDMLQGMEGMNTISEPFEINSGGLFDKESGKLKTEPQAYERQVGKGKGRGQNRLETKQISTMENNQGANNNEGLNELTGMFKENNLQAIADEKSIFMENEEKRKSNMILTPSEELKNVQHVPEPRQSAYGGINGLPLETLCDNSQYIDGIGYAEYPGYCQKLVQCYKYMGKAIAVERECFAGYFWNQEAGLCMSPMDVPCFDDPCLDADVSHYNRSGGCRSYYMCEYGISLPMCCQEGYKYNGDRCVPDPTCRDACITPYELENRLRYQSCKFLPDKDNPYGYITLEHNGLRIRVCPQGTIFSARQCGCRWMSRRRMKTRRRMKDCSPDFYMNFNTGFKELSGSNMAFDVNNVVINDGSAVFNGKGKITLWGYMNKELGKRFAIRLRFKPDPTDTESGSLISNCGMTGSPTVQVKLSNHQLAASAKSTSFMKAETIKDNFDPYSWNDVTYLYNGNAFVLSTNGYKQRRPVGGSLETRSNAIVIGGCPKPESGFKGQLDYIEIYSNCIPRGILKPRQYQ